MIRKIAITLILLASLTVLWFDSNVASKKPLWWDEGSTMTVSCAQTFGDLFVRGGLECSPPPLYFIAQRATVNALGFADGIFVKFRAVSLVASLIALASLCIFLFQRFGFFSAWLAFLMMIKPSLFHQYAAESRAYMSWMLCVTIAVLVASRRAKGRLWLILSLLCLTTVAAPGFLQACMILFVLAVTGAATLSFAIPLGAFLAGLGVFYDTRFPGCRGGSTTWNGLSSILNHENFQKLKILTHLFIPRADLIDWGGTLFIFLAIALTLNAVKKRDFSENLGIHVLFQLPVILFSAFLVLAKGYYFVDRLFISILAFRAMMAGIGIYGFVMIMKKFGRVKELQWALSIVLLLATAGVCKEVYHRTELTYPALAAPDIRTDTGADVCASITGPLKIRRIDMSNVPYEVFLNSLNDLNIKRSECLKSSLGNVTSVERTISIESTDGKIVVLTKPDASLPVSPRNICGSQVVL